MSAHSYHQEAPNYDDRQILHDGCPECERRGKNVPLAMEHLDGPTFRRAWQRAADWEQDREVGYVSRNEATLLQVLWMMQVLLERHAGLPIGILPGGVTLGGKR